MLSPTGLMLIKILDQSNFPSFLWHSGCGISSSFPPFLCWFPPSSSRSCPSLPDHPPVGPSNSCFVLFSALPRKSQSRINPVHHVTLPLSSPDSLLNDSLSLSLSPSPSPQHFSLSTHHATDILFGSRPHSTRSQVVLVCLGILSVRLLVHLYARQPGCPVHEVVLPGLVLCVCSQERLVVQSVRPLSSVYGAPLLRFESSGPYQVDFGSSCIRCPPAAAARLVGLNGPPLALPEPSYAARLPIPKCSGGAQSGISL